MPLSPCHISPDADILSRMAAINARLSVLHAIEGLDVSRCAEYAAAWSALRPHLRPAKTLLDIGSYRSPWPHIAASLGAKCFALDPDWAVSRQAYWARHAENAARVVPVVADGRSLPLANESVDFASAISTLEHIPADGDTAVIAGLRRVVRQDGFVFVTVPYSQTPKEGRWRRWFQRWYNEDWFQQRLIHEPGLAAVSDGYLLGGALGRFADRWYRLPAYLRHCLSWSHVLLARRADLTGRPGDARVRWALLRPA